MLHPADPADVTLVVYWLAALGLLCAGCDSAPARARVQPSAVAVVGIAATERAPLADWMKAELRHRFNQLDFARLTTAFEGLERLHPDAMERWDSFARDGVRAAAAHDVEGIRAACAICHTTYRALYRQTSRSQPIDMSDHINPRLLRRFRPVVGARRFPATTTQIALGRKLFFETRLSLNDDLSCSSCHALDAYGVDHRKTSIGAAGQEGSRNAPSVFNAASHIAQFWDGRSATVETQALEPILNPREMAMPSPDAVLAQLSTPAYAIVFRDAYPDDPRPITIAHVAAAIGMFERGLVTRSRWDDYLAGDSTALTAEEQHGLRVFLEVGCMKCHTGPQVGGTMFERLGVITSWPNETDVGRFAITHLAKDRMVFKVPSLKNVVETAPYFHDGSVDKLDEAVRMMGRHQLGIELTHDQVNAIVAWMASMTGQIDHVYVHGT